ncbi:MAG: NADH-quinone oxidoreductase subunit NuoN [Steroidobacteraceae bacterium]|jgi:NADH-quinone oxidoreductase subunit N|nr:NADH-quinone oxidoreductase subunit NuoN [Steroidobacteraceae bacterium]
MTLALTWNDVAPAGAEIFLLAAACAVLLVDLFLDDRRRWVTHLLTIVALAGAAAVTSAVAPAHREVALFGQFVADPMATVLKLFNYAVTAVVLLYSRDYLEKRGLFRGEYFVLVLFAVLGINVMVSAGSLLTMYLGIEILALSLYAMVAFDRDNGVAAESAMKYFVLGAIASGTLLYGISILYGVTGTFSLQGLAEGVDASANRHIGLLFGLAFVVVGIAFKFGAVPFHMWLPDVYHGAPTAVTLFVGSAPKLASFALAMRVLAEGLGGMTDAWQDMLVVLAVLSMTAGNLIAIAQTNIKRMLAYSTISHVGFILLGILAGTAEGYQAAMFYTLTYVVMATGGFGVILLLSSKGFEADELDDYKGLNQKSPWFAFVMLVLMFGMAGVPPMVGFWAKVQVISAVVGAGLTWLAVLSVLLSVVGAFYYLRVVKLMYFDAPKDDGRVEAAPGLRWVLSANALIVLALGLMPGWLLQVCVSALPG